MTEMSIMELFKWICYFTIFMCFASFGVYTHQVRETPNFKQHVNYQIERHGGLTNVALENINNYSEEHYNGRYTIDSPLLNEKVSFGEQVDYTVTGVFEIAFVPGIPDVEQSWDEFAISLVR